ncbi:MAG: hypothetical protein EHM49_00685 [Deltaproteobacteria bacterium]|nr:MAG: hypothetical protein EHM49_00685 [Deltaproteobacteria bacterium]
MKHPWSNLPWYFNPLVPYMFTAKDPTETYFGYTDRIGRWYIMKVGEEITLYVKGNSGFLAAWAAKESLAYDYFFNAGF